MTTTADPEDIKAELRKRFGSVANFERKHDLPAKSVTDVFRNRPSARVSQAIDEALSKPISKRPESEVSDNNRNRTTPHRLNSAAR